MTKNGDERAAKVVAGLEALGLKSGTSHQMAKRGQLLERCEVLPFEPSSDHAPLRATFAL